jgi:hypothetical protein
VVVTALDLLRHSKQFVPGQVFLESRMSRRLADVQGELHRGVGNVSGGFIGDGVFWRLGWAMRRHRGRSCLLINLVLDGGALAFDDDRVGGMQDAIEDSGGKRAVVLEDLPQCLYKTCAQCLYARFNAESIFMRRGTEFVSQGVCLFSSL